jgi:hypothetical protein
MATLASVAYLRFAQHGSDAYVFMHTDGYLACWNCRLLYESRRAGHPAPDHFRADSTQAMIDHLEQHRAAGHSVPCFDEVAAELRADDAENFG